MDVLLLFNRISGLHGQQSSGMMIKVKRRRMMIMRTPQNRSLSKKRTNSKLPQVHVQCAVSFCHFCVCIHVQVNFARECFLSLLVVVVVVVG